MELHVHLGKPEDNKIAIDGVDITSLVLREGFSIVMDDDPLLRPLVTVPMRATTVTVDGAEANLKVRPPSGVDPDDPEQVSAWIDKLREVALASMPAGGAR